LRAASVVTASAHVPVTFARLAAPPLADDSRVRDGRARSQSLTIVARVSPRWWAAVRPWSVGRTTGCSLLRFAARQRARPMVGSAASHREGLGLRSRGSVGRVHRRAHAYRARRGV